MILGSYKSTSMRSWRLMISNSYDRTVIKFLFNMIVISLSLRSRPYKSWSCVIKSWRETIVTSNDRDDITKIFLSVMNLYKFYLNKCDYSCSLCQNIFRQRAIRQNKERVTPSDTTITRKSKHWCMEIIHSR